MIKIIIKTNLKINQNCLEPKQYHTIDGEMKTIYFITNKLLDFLSPRDNYEL